MKKTFCDRCGKDITNDGKEHIQKYNVFCVSKKIDLCDVCHASLVDFIELFKE